MISSISKKIVTLLILLQSFCSLAQLNTEIGKIEYNVDVLLNSVVNNKSSTAKARDFSNEISKAAKYLSLELIYNKDKAVFKNTKSARPENVPIAFYNMAKRLSCKGAYYTDKSNNTVIQEIRNAGNTYLVSFQSEKLDWRLTKESKKIGEFICYKAITSKNVRNKSHDIIAWYAPSIPSSFGPLEYGGLPGLILELNFSGTMLYSTKKISFGKKQKIETPSEGILISYEEYKKMGTKAASQFKKSLRN